ncbi:hypothetical protein BH09PAT2_BH09PAT2_06470 [soil metagenome]
MSIVIASWKIKKEPVPRTYEDRIEELLVAIVDRLPNSTTARACGEYEECKVLFTLKANPQQDFYIKYAHSRLELWIASLELVVPIDIIKCMGKLFPDISRGSRPGIAADPIHFWPCLTEDKLRRVVGK